MKETSLLYEEDPTCFKFTEDIVHFGGKRISWCLPFLSAIGNLQLACRQEPPPLTATPHTIHIVFDPIPHIIIS